MMSFVSYENYKEKTLSGPGVPLSSIFKIGDIVDARIVDEYRDDMPPAYYDSSLVQMGEVYVYAKDDEGVSKPCYVTFSFDKKDWVFCGACFENSVINRSEKFERVPLTVAQYCIDKFDSEYIRAAERLYEDEKKGADITGLSVIDDYMDFDAFSMAGYWISVHEEKALDMFKENWREYQDEALYVPVSRLLEQKNKEFDSILWKGEEPQHGRSLGVVDRLIADASGRADGCVGEKEKNKNFFEFDL